MDEGYVGRLMIYMLMKEMSFGEINESG